MASQDYLARFAETCAKIGDASADGQGFVRIENLLQHFQTRLIVRPLLVEGMIAEIKRIDDPHGASHWAVLVDSESHGVEDIDRALREENRSQPLPTRMRYTIAHELAHSMAFRPDDFGLRLTIKPSDQMARTDFIKEIERGTDSVTPFLLLPTSSLRSWLRDVLVPMSADDLARLRTDMGVARQTLINRLMTLNSSQFCEGPQPALQNLAVGIGEWGRQGQTFLRKWPLFASFERELLPAFLIRLQAGQDRALAQDIFGPAFMFGDSSHEPRTVSTKAGTPATPEAEEMRVTITFENRPRRTGSEFLLAVHGTLVKRPVPFVPLNGQRQPTDRPVEGKAEEELERIRKILGKRG